MDSTATLTDQGTTAAAVAAAAAAGLPEFIYLSTFPPFLGTRLSCKSPPSRTPHHPLLNTHKGCDKYGQGEEKGLPSGGR